MNGATLAASTLVIACDAAQTYRAADEQWSNGRSEHNAILGRDPTAPAVLAYFTVAVVLNAAIWAIMPRSARSIVPAAVIAVQARSIAGNVATTDSVCGVPLR